MSDLTEALADALPESRLRKDRDAWKRRAEQAEAEGDELRRVLGWVDAVTSATFDPPKWLTTSPRSGPRHHGTVVVMLSDMHFDEVVRPEEVHGVNAYNRTIAEQRLERWTRNVVKLARNHLTGVTYDGCVLLLGGDTFSGDIHEELQQTNEDTALGSLLHWTEQMCAPIEHLAAEFGKLHVAAVPGNHGRTTRKPRAKLRARTNFDWLLAKQLERHFTKDKRVTFQVPEAASTIVDIYGWRHWFEHGDAVKGGGGIGGIWPPIMRLRARRQQYLASSRQRPFDTMWMGHWHQLIQTPDLVVNGSLKAFDEFASTMGYGAEDARQAFAIVTPEHNVTWQCPVYVTDREAEGW